MGFSRQEWVAISSSRGSFWPKDQIHILRFGRQVLYHWAPREDCISICCCCSDTKLCLTLRVEVLASGVQQNESAIHIHTSSLFWISISFRTLSSFQSLSHVQLFVTPWIAARQASLSITNSRSSPRLMSIKSVMPSSHLILCHSLLLLPPIPPSIRVFSNESTLR